MARLARFKFPGQEAWYHVTSRVAGARDEYPLADPVAARRLVEILRHFASVYFCEVAAFCVMGNHYHAVVRLDGGQPVEREELERRARILHPGELGAAIVGGWSEEDWARFERRLGDVSELMRNVQAAFARWYNRGHQRRGRFWADRFKSVLLEDEQAVLDCVLYVELNPVRAGLVERPEEWPHSSARLREIGKDGWLVPLARLLGRDGRRGALREFRERLYHRGSVPSRAGQAAISKRVLEEEAKRGFAVRGLYRKRLGFFVDGLAVGSESFLKEQLARLREGRQYLRRKNPVPQLGGVHLSLREQRSTAVVF